MRILLLIMLFISTPTFGFEINDDFEEEKRNQKTKKERNQIQKNNKLNKDQTKNYFLKRQNNEKPHFLKEEMEEETKEEIN